MIDLEHEVCYVKVPKTAGSSVLMRFLAPMGLTLDDGQEPPIINLNRVDNFRISDEFRMPGRTKRYNGWHVSARDMKRWLGARWSGFRTFTVVRDPFDRIVSNYEWQRSKSRPVGTFDEFVEAVQSDHPALHRQARLHGLPQLAWVATAEGHVLVDQVLKFEQLTSSFDSYFASLGLVASRLAHVNPSERRPVHTYYGDTRTIDRVLDLYRNDFETFGYPLRPPRPA